MSERIAEFDRAEDAREFCRLKGPDYEVVGGIHLMYAVMPKIQYPSILGSPDNPPEFASKGYVDPDDVDFDSDLEDRT